jgi:hypothetical protein
MTPASSLALSVLGILACGALGAFAGFAIVNAFGWSGTGAALVAVVVGMVVATAAWVLGTVLLRRLGWLH